MKVWTKIEAFFRPLKLLGGIVLVVVAIIIWVSMLLTGIDKAAHSVCGVHCGYVLGHISVFNPTNWVLVESSKIFPIDYVIFLLLTLLFFCGSVVGLATIGIRFLWLQIFQIRKGRTSPQAVLMATVMLTLISLAINYALAMMVAPQYSHFGPQTYCGHRPKHPGEQPDCSSHPAHVYPCTETPDNDEYASVKNVCTPSVASVFLDRITLNFPVFGVINFWAQFFFLGLSRFSFECISLTDLALLLVVFVTSLFRTPRLDEYQMDRDAEDEEEGLLASTGRRFGATWQDLTWRAGNRGAATTDHEED